MKRVLANFALVAPSGTSKAGTVRPRAQRPVPQLSAAQVAFHGGITENKEAFSLKNAFLLYSKSDAE